jgi:hypothetical protein
VLECRQKENISKGTISILRERVNAVHGKEGEKL